MAFLLTFVTYTIFLQQFFKGYVEENIKGFGVFFSFLIPFVA